MMYAALVGALSAPVMIGALGAAVLGAVRSARGHRPAEPRLLAPLPMGMATTRAHISSLPERANWPPPGTAVHNDAA